jgi:hypothetical protein
MNCLTVVAVLVLLSAIVSETKSFTRSAVASSLDTFPLGYEIRNSSETALNKP